MADEAPKRRLRMSLDLGSDDLPAMACELRSIAHDLEYEGREERDTTSGGYSCGYHLTVSVTDPEMTGERFREELEAWRVASVASDNTAPILTASNPESSGHV